MASLISLDRIRFLLNRTRERLWVRPLVVCLLSVAAAFVAKLADGTPLTEWVPVISPDSVETLLSIMAASMLVIATFSVSSMVSAYASTSMTATPRSFSLVISDDVSKNALSTFVGAFIFSIVAITAAKNDYFETAGLFILFMLTNVVFAIVIVTFVRWVDSIARLGRLGSTIDKVEKAAEDALRRRRDWPTLGAMPVQSEGQGQAVYGNTVGYVQHIDVSALQGWAERNQLRVVVAALPGTFAFPDRVLVYVITSDDTESDLECNVAAKAFQIGTERIFDDDPRFGLVVLSEIAGRALSPAVNDPGTAIAILGRFLRLFTVWSEPPATDQDQPPKYDRVEVPELSVRDMFDDAFMAIGRDGAAMVDISIRLQKVLRSLAAIGDPAMQEAAKHHADLALKRSKDAMKVSEDIAMIEVINANDSSVN